jgi:mRNA interferase RelE/StbE
VSYDIIWSAQAIRHFRELDKPVQERVAALVTSLGSTPRPATAKALVGMPGVLRVRTGDYRVLYSIVDSKQEVWIEDVRHRRKAYGSH